MTNLQRHIPFVETTYKNDVAAIVVFAKKTSAQNELKSSSCSFSNNKAFIY